MSSMTRSIKRGIIFANMNKQQKAQWSSLPPMRKREYEHELGAQLKAEFKFGAKKAEKDS